MEFTPENISRLKANQVFVFGSNLAGVHGAGAARFAHDKFGAEYGVGFGPTGQCFAIPTKDYDIKTMPISEIKKYVDSFLEYARSQPDIIFLVTKIGCGLAGLSVKSIAPMFSKRLTNVILPIEFVKVLEKGGR